jgi:hypothetical protein
MLDLNNTALIIIDVQGKLADLMYEKETLFKNLTQLVNSHTHDRAESKGTGTYNPGNHGSVNGY